MSENNPMEAKPEMTIEDRLDEAIEYIHTLWSMLLTAQKISDFNFENMSDGMCIQASVSSAIEYIYSTTDDALENLEELKKVLLHKQEATA